MNKVLLTAVAAIIAGGLYTVHAQNGFVIWSKGGVCARKLTYNEIKDGKPGPEKTVIERGEGADIFVQISYDGNWIAYASSDGAFDGYGGNKNGRCDYHNFDQYDIYIAKIDNGATIPAKGILVAKHGSWPSWGVDSDKPTKTLYWSDMDKKGISKATIGPDGTVSGVALHTDIPDQYWGGSSRHFQGSDDGKYVAYREKDAAMHLQDAATDKKVGDFSGGCHPAWGPQGYIMHASNHAFRVQGGKVTKLGSAGMGKYWYNWSNDVGLPNKIWIIGKTGGGGQNDAGTTEFKEVDVSGGGWKVGSGVKIGNGTGGDIHFWKGDKPDPTAINTKNRINSVDNFTAKVIHGAGGLQLSINSPHSDGYSAALYSVQGKQVAFIKMSGSSQNIMPLDGICNGKYFLTVSGSGIRTQKTIVLSR